MITELLRWVPILRLVLDWPTVISRAIYLNQFGRIWYQERLVAGHQGVHFLKPSSRAAAQAALDRCGKIASARLHLHGIEVAENMSIFITPGDLWLQQGSRFGAYGIPLPSGLAEEIQADCSRVMLDAVGSSEIDWMTRVGWRIYPQVLSRHEQIAALASCPDSQA